MADRDDLAASVLSPRPKAWSLLEQMPGAEGSVGGGGGISAYHASPYKFDKFEWSPRTKNTGEGGQAFAEGLYFAESPMVSGRGGAYDRQFTARNLGKYDTNQLESAVLMAMQPGRSDLDVYRTLADQGYRDFDAITSVLNSLRGGKAANIYEVNLRMRPEEMLDWDAPMTRQSAILDKVVSELGGEGRLRDLHKQTDVAATRYLASSDPADLNAFDALRLNRGARMGGLLEQLDQPVNPYGYDAASKVTGEQFYRALGAPTKGDATTFLRDVGVPGTYFDDAGSRAITGGKGSHNYVVFNDKLIDIVRRYGIAGALGAGLISEEIAEEMKRRGIDKDV